MSRQRGFVDEEEEQCAMLSGPTSCASCPLGVGTVKRVVAQRARDHDVHHFRFLSANATARALLSLGPSSTLHARDLGPRWRIAGAIDVWSRELTSIDTSTSFEMCLCDGPQSPRMWIDCHLWSVDGDGLCGFSVQDITAMKAQQSSVDDWKHKLEQIIHHVNCVVLEICAQSGRFTFASHQSETLLGIPPVHWSNWDKWRSEFVLPQDMHLTPTTSALSRSNAQTYEFRIDVDGDEKHVKMGVSGRADYSFVYAVMEDVTHSKRMQMMQQKQMEVQVRKDTRARITRELSHQLKTPISGILGLTRMLSERHPQDSSLLNPIRSYSEYLLSVLNGMLEVNKIEMGKEVELVHFRFSLLRVVHAVVNAIQFEEVDVVIDYSPSVPHHFMGDHWHMHQLLTSLLLCSTQQCRSSRTREHDQRVDTHVLSFRYNGSHLSIRITSPLHEGVDDDEDVESTSGELSRAVVCTLSSAMNAQTTHSVTADGRASVECVMPLQVSNDMKRKVRVNGKGQSVLLVCPELHCDVLSSHLREWSFKVLTCSDAQVAQTSFHANAFHVIIVDSDMSHGSAYLDHLRAQQLSTQVRVIQMCSRSTITSSSSSSSSSPSTPSACDGVDGVEEDVDDDHVHVLSKPVHITRLAHCVSSTPLRTSSTSSSASPSSSRRSVLTRSDVVVIGEHARDRNDVTNVSSPHSPVSSTSAALRRSCDEQSAAERVLSSSGAESASPSSTVGRKRSRDSVSGLRVLVVDDNHVNRLVMEHMLTRWSCAVTLARNGLEAIELHREALRTEQPFGVIIMDLMMPHMSGWEAAKRIRQHEDAVRRDSERVYIVALTAGEVCQDEAKVMSNILYQPVLRDLMRQVLEDRV